MVRFAHSKSLPLLALSTLVLSACAHQQTRSDAPSSPPQIETGAPPSSAPAPAPTPPAAASAPRVQTPTASAADSAQFTGVALCDEYLASYRACHRVVGAVDPALIDERLETLRATWKGMAADPARRDALLGQCQSLTDTMKQALNGRKCTAHDSDFVQPTD